MNDQKLFKLYLDFIGSDTIKIRSLVLTPIRVVTTPAVGRGDIYFRLENPNDECYYERVIYDDLLDFSNSFFKYTDIRLRPVIENVDISYFYVNKDLDRKIKNYFSSIRKIVIKNAFINDSALNFTIYGKSTGYNVHPGTDYIDFYNHFSVESAELVNFETNELITTDITRILELYEDYIYSQSSYYESEHIYQKMDEILDNTSAIDLEWVALYYRTSFFL